VSHVKDNLVGRVVGFHQTYRWDGGQRTVWGRFKATVPTIIGEAIIATNVHTGEEHLVLPKYVHTVCSEAISQRFHDAG
jgi:hypothetical protein